MERLSRVKIMYLVAGVCTSLWIPSTLRAASQVQNVVSTYGGNGFFNWDYKNADAYDKARSRRDIEQHRLLQNKPEQHVDIERIDLDKRWALDPQHQRYTEESISEANARMKQEMEKSEAEWDKKHKNDNPEKSHEDTVRIKSAKTTVEGPGKAVDINGFSCRPYTVKTVIEYESVKDQSPAGRSTLYDKQWMADSQALEKYHQDEMAFWQSAGVEWATGLQVKQLTDAMKKELEKARQDVSANPWMSHWDAIGKIKGRSVRTIFGMSFYDPGQTASVSSPETTSKDDSLVQPEDLSGSVGGVMTSIASRWASKKVEKKVQEKMDEHPAWVDDISKDLNGAKIGWGYMEEIISVTNNAPVELFEIPAGYKKVKSL